MSPYSSGCQFPPLLVVPNWWCLVCYKRSVGGQFVACCLACCGNATHHKISKSMSFIAAFFVCQCKALVGNPWMWCSYDRCFGNVNNKIAHPTPCFSQMNSNIFHSFLCFFQAWFEFLLVLWIRGASFKNPKTGISAHIFAPIMSLIIYVYSWDVLRTQRFFPIDVEVSLRCFDTNGCKSGERFCRVCLGVIVQLTELPRGYY